MTWNPLGPLTIYDPPTRVAERSRTSLLPDGIFRRMRTSRGPLIFAAIVQFLTAAVTGIVMTGICLLMIAFDSAEDNSSRTDPAEYFASGIVIAGAVALHVILGIGVLRRRTWALVTSVCLSPFYLVVAYLLATLPTSDGSLSRLQLLAIIASALIISADLLTLLQLKRAG